jgi:hypothetical protein
VTEAELVATALATGAAAGLTDTPRGVVHDLHSALREAVRRRLAGGSVSGGYGVRVLDAYDTDPDVWRTRLLQVLTSGMEIDAAQWSGKTSPVHHFWHTFDIAVTRFSDKRAALPPSADEVTRESYSREVISSGFWFGDPTFPEPAFYSYTAPEPEGLTEERLSPPQASWVPLRGGHLAVLRYDDVRGALAPRETVLEFFESAFRAGGRRAGWDLDAAACPGGVTTGSERSTPSE